MFFCVFVAFLKNMIDQNFEKKIRILINYEIILFDCIDETKILKNYFNEMNINFVNTLQKKIHVFENVRSNVQKI